MIAAPRQNVGIGRGDDAPAIIWAMPYAVYGSDFALAITVAGSPATLYAAAGPDTVTTYTVSGGGLVLDNVANTVTWTPTTAESAALPPVSTYTLRRIVPEVRYYAWGDLYGLNGPVWPSSVDVEVPGPQGALPSNAQIIIAVQPIIGAAGGLAGQDAFAAEVARAKAAENAVSTSVAAEATRAQAAETANAAAINTEVARAKSVETSVSQALSNEITRAQTAEGSLLPNTVIAINTLLTQWQAQLPQNPSASGPTWWSNSGQPTYS